MRALWRRFIGDESGQGLVEYVLIIAVIAVTLILVMYAFRNEIGFTFKKATNELNAAPQNTMS